MERRPRLETVLGMRGEDDPYLVMDTVEDREGAPLS